MDEKIGLEERLRLSAELFNTAYQHQMDGNIPEAIEYYRRSIETFPTAEAFTFLGLTMSFLGRYQEAIGLCKKAIEIDPNFGNPYNDIGAYLIELGKSDEAIPYLEKASAAGRYDSYQYPHYNLGRIWEQKGMLKKAIQSYQKSLEENPDYILARQALERIRGQLQ